MTTKVIIGGILAFLSILRLSGLWGIINYLKQIKFLWLKGQALGNPMFKK